MSYFEKPEKIRFQHIDKAGIVFYPRFLEMLNSLVEDWFEEALELSFADMHEDAGIPTVDLKVQFKAPARLGETIQRKLWVKKLGNSSVNCAFRFEKEDNSTVLHGEVMLVYVGISEDKKGISSCPFPTQVADRIKNYIIKE